MQLLRTSICLFLSSSLSPGRARAAVSKATLVS
jgi:hypothetical protein